MRMFGITVVLSLCLLSSVAGRTYGAEPIPLIDAYSRTDNNVDLTKLIAMMDRAGISRLILGARGKRSVDAVVGAAKANPNRITASAKIKTVLFLKNDPQYYSMIERQTSMPVFGAMSEITIFFAKKGAAHLGKKYSEITVEFDDPRIQAAVKIAKKKDWPVIVFLEFGSAGARYKGLMRGLKTFLRRIAPHPVILARMGQLAKPAVESLINEHSNIYFFTAHSNPIFMSQYKRRPWTKMFSQGGLTSSWEKLVSRHPDRFVLAFDNVFDQHWQRLYRQQACLWQTALRKLPHHVAHAIAHGNAERLWPALANGRLSTVPEKHWRNCAALLSTKAQPSLLPRGQKTPQRTKGKLCKHGNMSHCKIACARGFAAACSRLKRGH